MAAEKRQLAILNCDLADSTVLAEELDAEDFEAMIQGFFSACNDIVQRNSGVFAINTGDGFQAYFFPSTDWPAASYAITCGLDIHQSLKDLETPIRSPMRVRAGVSTGQVVLNSGESNGTGERLIAVGAPAHLAARLQAVAEPGSVFVDQTSYEQVKRFFAFTCVGTFELKGFARPVQVWRADGQKQWGSRFEERLQKLSPLVGRSQEIGLLMDRWQAAGSGEGQATLILGEPGIGKSRLVYEVCKRTIPEPISFQCLENHENTPLHPLTRYLEMISKIRPRDSLPMRRRKLDITFRKVLPLDIEHRRMLMALMSYTSSGPQEEDFSPQRKLHEMCDAMVAILLDIASASTHPLVVVVEDMHWIDPTSKVLLQTLVSRVSRARILVLVTCRLVDDVLANGPDFTLLSLNRLTRQQTIDLAKGLVEESVMERVNRIVEWSDGIPFYVEEIATICVDAGNGDLQATSPEDSTQTPRPPVPNSLQAPLLARLDRMGTSKKVAQLASVIGSDFDRETLGFLLDDEQGTLTGELEALVHAGILFCRDSMRESYSFKHALTQEAIYKSLLDRDVVVLHKRVADIYAREYPEMRDTRPEMLAYRLTLAREWQTAAELWLQAGLAAKETGSHLEAKGRLERGLEAVAQLDDVRRAKELKGQLCIALGQVIVAHFGPVDRAGHAAFEEAVEIGDQLDDANCLITAQTALMTMKYCLGTFSVTQSAADKLIDYAARAGNKQAAAVGLLGSGMSHFAMGHLDEARTRLQESLDYLEYGIQPAEGYPSKAYSYLGFINYMTGTADAEATLSLCSHAIEISAEHSALDLAAALGNSIYLDVIQGRIDLVADPAERLISLSKDKGYLMYYFEGMFFLGSVLAADRESKGLDMMEEAIERFVRAGEFVELSIFYGVLSDRYLLQGNVELARKWVERALAHVDTYGESFMHAPLLRLKARCVEHSDTPAADEIDGLMGRADRIANEQGAIIWQGGGRRPHAGDVCTFP